MIVGAGDAVGEDVTGEAGTVGTCRTGVAELHPLQNKTVINKKQMVHKRRDIMAILH
jgi:hypothetical protein